MSVHVARRTVHGLDPPPDLLTRAELDAVLHAWEDFEPVLRRDLRPADPEDTWPGAVTGCREWRRSVERMLAGPPRQRPHVTAEDLGLGRFASLDDIERRRRKRQA